MHTTSRPPRVMLSVATKQRCQAALRGRIVRRRMTAGQTVLLIAFLALAAWLVARFGPVVAS